MVQLALTSLVGLLAALQPAIAAPQRNPGSSDPATCIADNKLYRTGRTYRMNGGDYIVRCARDSTGNAMSSQKVMWGGFATCFNLCERTKNCAGFTYVGSRDSGTCYLKSSLGGYPASTDDLVTCEKSPDKEPGRDPEPLPSSSWTSVEPPRTTSSSWYSEASTTRSDLNTFSPTDVSTTAPAPTPSANECQQAIKQYGEVYRGGSGSAYQLSCGTDHYGGDLNDAESSSFIGCVAVCDSKPDCIGYAYTPDNCWLKSYLTAKEVNSGVDFAINLERNATAKPRSSTTASPSSTAPTVKPTPKAGSCGFIDGKTLTSSANNRYTIECGADHNGGDIGGGPANTFTDCADICDKVDKCIGYAWAGGNGGNGPGTCYLKGTVTNRETNADVDYAYKDAATYLPSSSSSSTRSYPPTSTSVVTPVSTSSTSSYVKPTWTERPPPPPKETTSSTSTRSAYTPPPPPPPKETTSSTSTRSIHTPPPPPPKETTSSTSARSTYTPPPPPPKETTSSTTSASVTNPVSTSCRTITFSTSGTTRVSTVTDYVSKSYTHVEWITSTTKPATTTATPQPTGDKDRCKDLRSKKPKKLRVNVIDGNRKFHNMWIRDPRNQHPSSALAQLSTNWEEAASVFLDPIANTLSAWYDRKDETCTYWGLNMRPSEHGVKGRKGKGRNGRHHDKDDHDDHDDHDRDDKDRDDKRRGGKHHDKNDYDDEKERGHHKTGEAYFWGNQGSGFMFPGRQGIEWRHERFGGWLVCDSKRGGVPELRFWDPKAGKEEKKWKKDCARAELQMTE